MLFYFGKRGVFFSRLIDPPACLNTTFAGISISEILKPLFVIENELADIDGAMTPPECRKFAGELASSPVRPNWVGVSVQAKIESSSENLMISSWSLINASLPSP